MTLPKKRIIATTAGGIGLLVVGILCFNIIASRLYTRFDVTQDRIYSLSDGTKKILSKLENNVSVRFYFSRSARSLPAAIKTYATRVEEVLKEYSLLSGHKITVQVVDPQPDTDDE